MTTSVDLNLLLALDALLQEGSVSRAAERAHLTVPAMSRALGRLRAAVGDELLVRAGRHMVLTPVAAAMRERVHAATAEARVLLQPTQALPLALTERTLVIRCNEAVAALLAAPLEVERARDAPRVRLRFVHEGEEDATSLRDGRVDLDIGVIDFAEPELMTRQLARDRFVGVVRKGHALLRDRVSAKRLADERHIAVSRRGRATGPIDEALRALGLSRAVVSVVPDFLGAFHAVARSELVSAAPRLLVEAFAAELPIAPFALPLPLPEVAISMAWHPRMDADPAHQWLRRRVQESVGPSGGDPPAPRRRR